jgi:hypothetical protein
MTRRNAILALASITASCKWGDTSGYVGAIIVDDAGAPIVGADVHFACPLWHGQRGPGLSDGARAVTDATGAFIHTNIPDIDESCNMTVDKAGFVPRVLTRKDVAYSKKTLDGIPLPRVVLDRAK